MTNSRSNPRFQQGRVLVSSRDVAKEESEFEAHYARQSWPLKNINVPHNNDVLFGRGGGTNNHPGNRRYRQLVEERKARYVRAARNEKPLIALEIVTWLREKQTPPGRFLQMNEMTNKWDDVGFKRAREKASQALREKSYATHVEAAFLQNEAPYNYRTNNSDDRFDTKRDPSDPVIPSEIDDIFPQWLGDSISEDPLTLEGANSPRGRSISVNSLQLEEVFSQQPRKDFYFENEENKSPQPPSNSRIKRSTSYNVENMKELKLPRRGTIIPNGLERQHSLAAYYLPGAVLDSPASPFFDDNEFGLSRQLSELSVSLDVKQLSELFYG
jgi:hypothetical protein